MNLRLHVLRNHSFYHRKRTGSHCGIRTHMGEYYTPYITFSLLLFSEVGVSNGVYFLQESIGIGGVLSLLWFQRR